MPIHLFIFFLGGRLGGFFCTELFGVMIDLRIFFNRWEV